MVAVRRTLLLAAIALPVLILQSGCGFRLLSEGEPNFNTGLLMPQGPGHAPLPGARDAKSLSPDALPDDCPDNPPSKDKVKACVYALKAIIDDHYREYRITLHHFVDNGNAITDVATLALTTAATATPAAAAKTVLAAIATFLGGSKDLVNQDVLFKQSIELILNQMDADRDQQFTVMIKEMNDDGYTIQQARDDLLEYFRYGTFDHAISSLQTKVAANKANCKAQLDNTKAAPKPLAAGKGSSGPATAVASGCPSATVADQ